MTEQEQAWLKQFIELNKPYRDVSHDEETRFFCGDTHRMWIGFRQAKRNMPVIELPQGHLMDDPDGMGRGRYLMIETVERALNRAGAKYTIKGE
jgi:hypothetical protein